MFLVHAGGRNVRTNVGNKDLLMEKNQHFFLHVDGFIK